MTNPGDVKSLHNLAHDPALANTLGNMVVTWAYAESVLFVTFARITGITVNMAVSSWYRIPTFEARVKFLRALLPEWKTDKHDKAAIDKAIEKLAKLSITRNGWVHGYWCQEADDPTKTVTVDFRASLGERLKPVKEHDVRAHCETVIGRASDLIKLTGFGTVPV